MDEDSDNEDYYVTQSNLFPTFAPSKREPSWKTKYKKARKHK